MTTGTMPRNYINIMLEYKGKRIQTKALIDTGNTISEQCAMNKELHNQLRAGFTSLGGKPVGTASPHHKIPKLGVSKEIVMKIGGIQKKFSIKPMVVSNMTDEFNIGARFFANKSGQYRPIGVHNGIPY